MSPAARGHWSHAASVAVLCTGFLFAYGGVPKINDERLYLPIARAVADPGLYPAGDLIVSSGLRGPFFLYRMASVLYSGGLAVDQWWLGAYVVSTVALFIALWWLAHTLSGSATVAAVATALLTAASAYRGTLHWFLLPPPNLVVSTLALPPLIAAFVFALRGRRGPGLVVASLVFNLHPSMGLISAAGIGVLMLRDVREAGWRSTLGWFAVALVCSLPTAAFIARTTPGNFATPDPAAFRAVFRTYSWHVFPIDHWREGYGFFVLGLGALALLARRSGAQRDAVLCSALFVVMIVAYLANLATVDVISIDLLFLFRAAPFVKLFVWMTVAASLASQWHSAEPVRRRWLAVCGAAFILAALSKNGDIGEGFAAIGCAAALVACPDGSRAIRVGLASALAIVGAAEILAPGWGVLHVAPSSPDRVTAIKLTMIGMAAVWLASTVAWRVRREHEPAFDSGRTPAGGGLGVALLSAVAIFAVSLGLQGRGSAFRAASFADVQVRSQMAVPDAATRDVIAWARTTPRGSLFAVPPTDDRFSTLRLAAGRGLYIQAGEVIQVAYDVAAAAEAHRRVLALGTRFIGRHEFDASAYATLGADSVAALARDGVDFAIFPGAARAAKPLAYPAVYTDSLWTVLDLRRSR